MTHTILQFAFFFLLVNTNTLSKTLGAIDVSGLFRFLN